MSWLDGFRYRLRAIFQARRLEEERARESEFHLSLEAMQRTHGGDEPRTATLAARRAFGNVTGHRQALRALSIRDRLDAGWRDLRHALRSLRRAPSYLAGMVGTLAVGFGTIAAVGTLIWGVLLRPLPYPDATRLVQVEHTAKALGASGRAGVSDGLYLEYRRPASPFDAIGLYIENDGVALTDRDDPVRLTVAVVSPGLLPLLGARAAAGRLFTADEERPDAASLVIISHALWVARYGSDPSIVGRTLELNRKAFQVVGVMAPEFSFPSRATSVWYNRTVDPSQVSLLSIDAQGIGRLRPGVTADEAEVALGRLIAGAVGRYPDATPSLVAESGFRPLVTPLKQAMVRDVRDPLRLLGVAAILVLLATLANASNLVLIRAEAHRREVAVARALGATDWDVARRILAEVVLLTALGAVVGTLLAAVGVALRFGFDPKDIPRLQDISLDWATAGVVVSLAVTTVLTLTALAARAGRDRDLLPSLHGSSARIGPRAWGRTQRIFAGAQIAFAAALLLSAGLLGKSLLRLQAVELGFVPDRIATVQLDLPYWPYPSYLAQARFYTGLLGNLRSEPGVTAVEAASSVPLSAGAAIATLPFEAATDSRAASATMPPSMVSLVTPGYFRLLGIPVVRGRTFERGDLGDSVPAAIVSAALGRRLFGADNPVGREIRQIWPGFTMPSHRIVGVVGDVPGIRLADGPAPWIYFPILDDPTRPRDAAIHSPLYPGYLTVLIRSEGSLAALAPLVRSTVRGVDAKVPVARFGTLEETVDGSLARFRLTTLLLLIGAIATLLLGAIGVYGVIAFLASQRTREFGVRIALGATPHGVERMVIGQASAVAAVGIVGGVLGGLALARGLRSLLYEVSPLDPLVLALVPVVILGVVAVASYLPARRAGRTDPVTAIRSE